MKKKKYNNYNNYNNIFIFLCGERVNEKKKKKLFLFFCVERGRMRIIIRIIIYFYSFVWREGMRKNRIK